MWHHRFEQDAADTQAAGATCDCDEEWNRRLPRDRTAECCWSTSTVRYEAGVTKGHARDELCADVTHTSPPYRTQDSTRWSEIAVVSYRGTPQWFRHAFSLRRPAFDPRTVHRRIVVGKVASVAAFSATCSIWPRFSPSVIIPSVPHSSSVGVVR
jgi:hypothetical protein